MTQDVMEEEDIEEIITVGQQQQMNGVLRGLMHDPTALISKLPQCMKKRVNALKNIQVQCEQLEAKFYEEAHSLEMKYAALFKPHYDKRKAIVNSEYEPTKEEIKWVEPGEVEPDEEEKEKEKDEDEKMAESILNQLKLDENTQGIPEFWLTVMKNVELTEDMIKEQDEDILKHLIDVTVTLTGMPDEDGSGVTKDMGFILEFHFSPNDYFSDSVLTKTYKMNSVPDKDDPFSFDGPEIYACTGCDISWKKGKNVTQKLVKKKQKQKGGNQIRFVTKTVKTDSFFNFFDPPDIENEDELDEETEELLAADFEIGDFFRQRMIPKAVLFYTGEAMEEFDDSDEEDDNEGSSSAGENEGDSDEEEEDDDVEAWKEVFNPQLVAVPLKAVPDHMN